MQQFFLILVLITGWLQVTAQNLVPDSVAQKFNKLITDLKDKQQCPGLAIAIVHENDIIFSEALGYTDLENKTPATIDSRFPIMSVSKTFTATVLMQLVERGVVALNDKVAKYVPEYKVRSGYPGPVATTLLQLATHAAGLPRNTPADVKLTESFDRWLLTGGKDSLQWFSTDRELLQSLQYVKLEYPPFHYISYSDRHYSNLGYSILGIALQRAAKKDFAIYVVNNICRPLQMTGTGYLTEQGIDTKLAKGYRYNPGSGTHDKFPFFVPNSALYAGGMYSTARDMGKYISFQFENDDPRYAKVLSPDNRAMMRMLKIGWKPAYPYVTHEGAIPGYRSIVAFNPDAKIGWVILTNANDIDFNPVNNAFAEILNGLYRKPLHIEIDKYAGTYQLPGGYGSMKIIVKNDSLYTTYLQDLLGGKPMVADGQNRFKVAGTNISMEFVPGNDGDIKMIRYGQLSWYKQH